LACDAGGESILQPHIISHDKAAHHTRNDTISQNHFLPCGNEHTGRRKTLKLRASFPFVQFASFPDFTDLQFHSIWGHQAGASAQCDQEKE
jgi:hypothetical protein